MKASTTKGGAVDRQAEELYDEFASLPGNNWFLQEDRAGKIRIVKSRGHLPTVADPAPFREHIAAAKRKNQAWAVFDNPKHTAMLVTPTQTTPTIAAYAAKVSLATWKAFWKFVHQAKVRYERKIGRRVFVSTHGFGVAQLHVRLEAQQKYYTPR